MPYGQTLAEFMTQVRTFRSVFPRVTLAFGPGGNGVFFFGSSEPIRFDATRIREVLSRPGVMEDLASAPDASVHSIEAWTDLIPSLLIASGADVDKVVGSGDIISDDRPLSEYFLLRRMAHRDATVMSEDSSREAFDRPRP